MISRFFLFAVLLLLAGCQATNRYEPKGKPGTFGYSSQAISARRFVVMFEGDPLTKLDEARDFALLRAAELTREAGGTHFKVTSEQNVIRRRFDEEGIPVRSGRPAPEFAAPPQYGPIFARRDYPVAWLEIEIYSAEPPAQPGQSGVYNAAETQAALAKRHGVTLPDRSKGD